MGMHNKDEYSQNNLTLLFGALALATAALNSCVKKGEPVVKSSAAAAAQVVQVSAPVPAASAPVRR